MYITNVLVRLWSPNSVLTNVNAEPFCYRTMHYSAQHGIAIAWHLSVRL